MYRDESCRCGAGSSRDDGLGVFCDVSGVEGFDLRLGVVYGHGSSVRGARVVGGVGLRLGVVFLRFGCSALCVPMVLRVPRPVAHLEDKERNRHLSCEQSMQSQTHPPYCIDS